MSWPKVSKCPMISKSSVQKGQQPHWDCQWGFKFSTPIFAASSITCKENSSGVGIFDLGFLAFKVSRFSLGR